MDPNATLQEIRDTIKLAGERSLTGDEWLAFMERVEDLDDWLSAPRRGFLPHAWDRDRRHTT